MNTRLLLNEQSSFSWQLVLSWVSVNEVSTNCKGLPVGLLMIILLYWFLPELILFCTCVRSPHIWSDCIAECNVAKLSGLDNGRPFCFPRQAYMKNVHRRYWRNKSRPGERAKSPIYERQWKILQKQRVTRCDMDEVFTSSVAYRLGCCLLVGRSLQKRPLRVL